MARLDYMKKKTNKLIQPLNERTSLTVDSK